MVNFESNPSNPIKYLCGLEELNLSDNNFKSLPADLHKEAPALRVLNMTNNQKFGDLESIMKIKTLEELYLRGTAIKTLPNSLADLPNLTVVEGIVY